MNKYLADKSYTTRFCLGFSSDNMELTLETVKYLQPQRRVIFPLCMKRRPDDGKTLCRNVLSNELNIQQTKKQNYI